jgi:hypothetical protein
MYDVAVDEMRVSHTRYKAQHCVFDQMDADAVVR